MKASLVIEAIGHDAVMRARLWRRTIDSFLPGIGTFTLGHEADLARWGVWEIERDEAKMVYGRTDYSRANSKGSRGVRICYLLESGKRYFIRAPFSWKGCDEYFCHVDEAGEIVRE